MPNRVSPLITTHLTNVGNIEPKNKAKHILTKQVRQLIRKVKDNYSDKPLSMRNISIPSNKPTTYTRRNLEKLSMLDKIHQEKGSEGVFKYLSSQLKDLQPTDLLSIKTRNPEETFESQSIKKYLNNKLEKEINKTISSITKETQLEKQIETADPNSNFSRHKLFQPLVDARNNLQKKHNLDVFTDQLSNRAQKELLGMNGELRAQLVKSNIYDNNISPENEEILNECASNNYKRNYSHFPENLPTDRYALAKTIIDFNLDQIHEEIEPKKTHDKKLAQPKVKKTTAKEKKKIMEKKTLALYKKISELRRSGNLNALNLEEKYQEWKSSNFKRIIETTKTELETQAYVEKLTLDVVRETLGEKESKLQIDDKWKTIKAELDAEIKKTKNIVIESIHVAQGRKPIQTFNKTEAHLYDSIDNADNNTEAKTQVESDLKNQKSQVDEKWNAIKSNRDAEVERIKNIVHANNHSTQGRKPIQTFNKTEAHLYDSIDNADNNTEAKTQVESDLKNKKSQVDEKWNATKSNLDAEVERIKNIVHANNHSTQDSKPIQDLNKTEAHLYDSIDNADNNTEAKTQVESDLKNKKSQVDEKWNATKSNLDAEIERIKNIVHANNHSTQDSKPMQDLNKTEAHLYDSIDNADNNTEAKMQVESDLKNQKSQIDEKWNAIKSNRDAEVERIKNIVHANNHSTQDSKPIQDLNKTETHSAVYNNNYDNNTKTNTPIASVINNTHKNKEKDIFDKVETIINESITGHLQSSQHPKKLTITPMPHLEIHINENDDKSIDVKYDAKNVKSKVFVIDYNIQLNKLINDKWKKARY
ncbi:MAG: hypothetical protein QS721_06445 [Candidatus Endonucleobacter sp. (ex Gigantidas childressi)]|nr:hypothetical protein [Candidatus Endonucleobacter sp. (ex Gigantidas childressi)]